MIQLLPIDLCVIDSKFAKACFQIMKRLQKRRHLVFNEEGVISEQNYMISFALSKDDVLSLSDFNI